MSEFEQHSYTEQGNTRCLHKEEPFEFGGHGPERLVPAVAVPIFAKLESGKRITLQKVNLTDILAKTVRGMIEKAQERGITIVLDTPYMSYVMANPLIEDVAANFISNAIKYGPTNSQVIVGITEKGNSVRLWVADKGENIPDKNKQRIFDKFTRLEKGVIEGSRLGLAIVKEIVELHNGKVWVEDNIPHGSVFIVEIPK